MSMEPSDNDCDDDDEGYDEDDGPDSGTKKKNMNKKVEILTSQHDTPDMIKLRAKKPIKDKNSQGFSINYNGRVK